MRHINSCIAFIILFFSSNVFGQNWSAVTPRPGAGTDGAFSFTIDGISYVGGGVSNTDFYAYQPVDDQWTKMADYPSLGNTIAWAFSFSINGKGYVVGGSYETANDLSAETWEYDPAENTWTPKADFPGGTRDAGFSFAVSGKGYIGAGFDGTYLNNDLWEYDPVQDDWTELDPFPGGAVIFPVAFVIDNKAYVGTGGRGSFSTDEIQQFWMYDPVAAEWTRKADFAGLQRQAAVGFTVGNKGYIGGGMSAYSTIRSDFWEYNPSADEWSLVGEAGFPTDTLAWSTVFVQGNEVFVGTGVDLPDFNFSNAFYRRNFSGSAGVSVNTNPISDITLYPLPVTQTLHLDVPNGLQIQSIHLYDLHGREVKSFEPDTDHLDLSGIQPGHFIIRIQTNSGDLRRVLVKSPN